MQKKKTIFLAVILVLGIAFMLSLFNVETGRAANLVQNPGFETGALSPWSGSGKTVVGTTNAHSGTYAMKVVATGGYGQQVVTVSPNTSYVLTAWLKTTTTGTQGKVGVKDYGGTDTFQISTSNTYTQLTVYFTTGASNTSATIYCSKPTSDYIYCDDFSLDAGVMPTSTPTTGPTPTAGPSPTTGPTPTTIPGVNIAPTDANIEYIGRWDKSNSSNYVSSWGGAYLRVRFTGTTVRLNLAAAVNLEVNIDGAGYVEYLNVPAGTLDLTPTPLASGTHTLVVVARFGDDELNFQGLILDEGASTVAPETSKAIIEFIGDSITAGHMTTKGAVTDFAWLTGEGLGDDHTQIAYSGVTLVSGYHYSGWYVPGMDVAEFKAQAIGHCVDVACANVPAWNFANYTAKVAVINLGTNDSWVSPSTPTRTFQSNMTTFLANVRTKYPNAEIFVMRTFAGVYVSQTKAAVNARISAGDTHVHYIDTTGWLTSGDYNPDGAHPNDGGHIKIANNLMPILAPYK